MKKEIKYSHYSPSEQLIFLMMIFALGGLIGFIYEELFYRIDLGYWVKRGSTFGPWIPIYGVGSVLIILFTNRLREKPWCLVLLATTICGLLEYSTGWMELHFFHRRLWDYNTEIWNWGNIGGFVCLRSIFVFAMASIFLQYMIAPCCSILIENDKLRKLRIVAAVPAILFLLDIVVHAVMKR